MEPAASGDVNRRNADAVSATNGTDSKPEMAAQDMRQAVPVIGVHGHEPASASSNIRTEAVAGQSAGEMAETVEGKGGNDGERETAEGAIPPDSSGGGGEYSDSGGGAGSHGASGVNGSNCGSSSAAPEDEGDAVAGRIMEPDPGAGKLAGEHLSRKYTKEELMTRHWGMNLSQVKRVKALLRMGVNEEDLEMADRLLKLGRKLSYESAPTKEEQLLGYTAEERHRLKALQILGLTEESFERYRSVMLSSLGPSAFGFSTEDLAESAVRAIEENDWMPGEKFRRRGPGGIRGSLKINGMLKIPTFGSSGAHRNSRLFSMDHGVGFVAKVREQARRASDMESTVHALPIISVVKRKPRQVGVGFVAAGSPEEGSAEVSTANDPS